MPSREYWTFPINTNKKGIAEDEIDPSPTQGHEFEQTPGDNEGQGSLAVHGVMESWT